MPVKVHTEPTTLQVNICATKCSSNVEIPPKSQTSVFPFISWKMKQDPSTLDLGSFSLFLLFCFWLCWAFIATCGLSLDAANWGYSLVALCGLLNARGFSCCGEQALGMQAQTVEAYGLSCSAAREIFPDQGSKLCPLHRQVHS